MSQYRVLFAKQILGVPFTVGPSRSAAPRDPTGRCAPPPCASPASTASRIGASGPTWPSSMPAPPAPPDPDSRWSERTTPDCPAIGRRPMRNLPHGLAEDLPPDGPPALDFWVAAHLRRCAVEGLSAVQRRRGAPEAGAIFVKVSTASTAAPTLYGPAPPGPVRGRRDRRRAASSP